MRLKELLKVISVAFIKIYYIDKTTAVYIFKGFRDDFVKDYKKYLDYEVGSIYPSATSEMLVCVEKKEGE